MSWTESYYLKTNGYLLEFVCYINFNWLLTNGLKKKNVPSPSSNNNTVEYTNLYMLQYSTDCNPFLTVRPVEETG